MKNDPLVSVQGHFNPKFTTLSSQYKVKIEKKWPSRLSTRSLQSKIYDPLVSLQGQNENKNDPLVSVQGQFNPKFTTLLSQYKVTSIQNLWPCRLSTRSLQSKIYDPLVSVQGQNWKKRSSRLSTRSKSRTTTFSSQYKVKMKNNNPLALVQGHSNPKFTTLSSQYKVKIEKKRPSRLSTRSLQSKIYDPLVSVQGQNENKNDPLVLVQGHFNPKFTTLSSQYRVTSIQNLRPSGLSTRSKLKKKRPSRLSTRSLQSKIYDPLVSVQGQNENKNDPLVSVQGHFNPKFTTLSSQYRVTSIQNLRPSRLSTRSKLKKKPTLSSQYKFKMKTKTTLSSQYRVTSIQNLRPSCLSRRSL